MTMHTIQFGTPHNANETPYTIEPFPVVKDRGMDNHSQQSRQYARCLLQTVVV